MRASRLGTFFSVHGKSFLVLFVICLVILVYAVLGDQGFLHLHRLQGELRDLQQQVAEIEDENRKLREEIKRLKSDPECIERLARQELGMLRENETLFLFQE